MERQHKNLDFVDYWREVRDLTPEERGVLYSSLSKNEQNQIKQSYDDGGWKDVFLHNQIGELCDEIKENKGVDLHGIKARIVIKKDRILIKKDLWDEVLDMFHEYRECFDLSYIFGGIGKKVFGLDPSYYELHYRE
jgi:hypothetical protein